MRHHCMLIAGAMLALSPLAAEAGHRTVELEPGALPDNVDEYSSFSLRIDHLTTNPFPGRAGVVMPTIWSEADARQSLVDMIGYYQHYGSENLLLDPEVFATVAAGLDKDVIYIYTPNDRRTEILVDAGIWSKILTDPLFGGGSVMGAHKSLVALAMDMKRAARNEGKRDDLLVFVPA